MKYKFIIIPCLLVGSVSLGSWAAAISPEEALDATNRVLNKDKSARQKNKAGKNDSVTKFGDEIYIVNSADGGWALVANDDRTPQMVLAYSFSGTFSLDNIQPSTRSVLEGYAREIAEIDLHESSLQGPTRGGKAVVGPLLGETAWGQNEPYNLLCPVLNDVGQRAVTGCVNTAISQIMYYHKYPAQGRGSHSYDWNGKTLSMDFSQSRYQWNLMRPVYDGSESAESRNAVAKLMYDCGIANESSYGYSTGANLNTKGLVEYFGYDRSLFTVYRNFCTREEFETILRNELDARRPVTYGGGGAGGGHEFVCDGYDADGYFHFNFGWDGLNNGYFLTSATGFDSGVSMVCSIQPDKGGKPTIWAGSNEDMEWWQDGNLHGYFEGRIASGVPSDIEIGLAVTDNKSDKVKYYVSHIYPSSREFYVYNIILSEMVDNTLVDDLTEDGIYSLSPVYRIRGEEWKQMNFQENCRNYVNIEIKNGEKTYVTPEFETSIDPGVELINGLYYRFEDGRAVLTKRNNRMNCYSGDITIPASVDFEGKTYPVTGIGDRSLAKSQINELTLGSNVTHIEPSALSSATVGKINYASPSRLKNIEGFAFQQCKIDEVRLPAGVDTIRDYVFESCSMKLLDLPVSLSRIGACAFCWCENLKDVYVHWIDKKSLPNCARTPFEYCDVDMITLHIPEGTREIYTNDPVWGIFMNVREDSPSGITAPEAEAEPKIIRSGEGISFEGLPENQYGEIYTADGSLVARCASNETIYPGKGFFIVRLGNKALKVIL